MAEIKIPVLTGKMICRGQFDGPNGTHCLHGWNDIMPDIAVRRSIHEALHSRAIKGVAVFNPKNPKPKVAALWNRAVKSLGYVRRGKWWVKPKGRGK